MDEIVRARSLSPLPPLSKKEKREAEQELIDFDVIKSSALFHTKPSKHDKELVKKAFRRIIFFPFCRQTWNYKQESYDLKWHAYCLSYAFHCFAVILYYFYPNDTSDVNTTIEVFSPISLLVITAICYARASALFLVSDKKYCKKSTNILSPTHGSDASSSSSSSEDSKQTRKGSGILEEGSNSDSSNCDSYTEDNDLPSGEESVSSSTPFSPSSFDAEKRRNVRTRRSRRRRRRKSQEKPPSISTMPSVLPYRRINVCIWDANDMPIKHTLSIDEVRSVIISKVKSTPPRNTYRYIGLAGSILISILPLVFRIVKSSFVLDDFVFVNENALSFLKTRCSNVNIVISTSSVVSTFFLTNALTTALADAEMTYHHRLLYAKCFTALTSSRRARQVGLPHFRLKNVVNIKAWFSLRGGRSWLKRQGHQRAADEVVSSCFFIVLCLLLVMGVHVMDNNGMLEMYSLFHVQVTTWFLVSSVYLLRFLMLGSNINKKYQNTSLLLTEQMNLYLRMVQAPHKKDRLLISNNVLKLATKLLKELRSPNKISGLTMNPLLYNISRVVVLSAISAAMTDVLGFKLKIWKI